jgi:hypothetical protein
MDAALSKVSYLKRMCMTILENQIKATLLSGMHIPNELSMLFSWIEEQGFYIDTDHGRIGSLYSDEALREEWGDEERKGGTIIDFFPEGNVHLKHWFGHDRADVLDRLCVFAKTGAEGSMAAFWLDDAGHQKIVHLGSGSGSTLVCVLADQPVDFLRLIAIGYDEICWNEYFSETPNASSNETGMFVHPNVEFQHWVKDTFKVDIPATAAEIIRHPSEMGDMDSKDEFCQWVEANLEP